MNPDELTWLRPAWLWALLPLLAGALWLFKRRQRASAWETLVDVELQPYVLEGGKQSRQYGAWLLLLAWAFSLLLLAGPVWQKQDVPVFKAEQAEVIVFDLSRSMRSDDLQPDRLSRARFKLIDLLSRSEGRLTGLIAFAERPYVISPLTDDTATVEAFVPSLDPAIMPAQGSRLDLAIERATALLAQAGIGQGHIVVLSDATVQERDRLASAAAFEAGHRLSVVAVGTSRGAPLRDAQGQFVQRANGSIVVARLDMPGMQSLARAGGGLAVELVTGSEDLDTLEIVRQRIQISADSGDARAERNYWVEYAPWGVWLLLAGLLSAFRKGEVM